MFKNPDGTYNKFQLLIIASIVVIGFGLILISIIPDIQNINIDPLYIIFGILIITGGYIIKRILSRPKIKSIPVVTPEEKSFFKSTPSKKEDTTSFFKPIPSKRETFESELKREVKKQEKSKPRGSGIDMMSLVITFIIGVVILAVGSSLVNTMVNAIPQVPETSAWSTQQETVNSTLGSAFSLMGLAIPIFFLIMIFGFISKMIKY